MNFLRKTWELYYDGFRSMTLGKVLWAVIAVKLFIIFFVLRLFFFQRSPRRDILEINNEYYESSTDN